MKHILNYNYYTIILTQYVDKGKKEIKFFSYLKFEKKRKIRYNKKIEEKKKC